MADRRPYVWWAARRLFGLGMLIPGPKYVWIIGGEHVFGPVGYGSVGRSVAL